VQRASLDGSGLGQAKYPGDQSWPCTAIAVFRPERQGLMLAPSRYLEDLFEVLALPDEVVRIRNIGLEAL
jgi:hypothetical protein